MGQSVTLEHPNAREFLYRGRAKYTQVLQPLWDKGQNLKNY